MLYVEEKQRIYYIWIAGVLKEKMLNDKQSKYTKIKFKKLS